MAGVPASDGKETWRLECRTLWPKAFLLSGLAKRAFGKGPLDREKQAGPIPP